MEFLDGIVVEDAWPLDRRRGAADLRGSGVTRKHAGEPCVVSRERSFDLDQGIRPMPSVK